MRAWPGTELRPAAGLVPDTACVALLGACQLLGAGSVKNTRCVLCGLPVDERLENCIARQLLDHRSNSTSLCALSCSYVDVA